MAGYHESVLLHESIAALNIRPDGIYVDVTFGGGGHSREILSHLENGRLIAFDQDEQAAENRIQDQRFTLLKANFRFLSNFLLAQGIKQIDGLLADLGVSSHHFDAAERGFSIRFEGPLDMRMNRQSNLTAAAVINGYTAPEMARVFGAYGDVSHPGWLAGEIIKQRESKPFETTGELTSFLEKTIRGKKAKDETIKVFQALRIEVNDELKALEDLLRQSVQVLKPGGRLSVISYHSGEDRLVKQFIRTGNFEGKLEKDLYGNPIRPFTPVQQKAIKPTEEEITRNPRARSARLRIAERNKE